MKRGNTGILMALLTHHHHTRPSWRFIWQTYIVDSNHLCRLCRIVCDYPNYLNMRVYENVRRAFYQVFTVTFNLLNILYVRLQTKLKDVVFDRVKTGKLGWLKAYIMFHIVNTFGCFHLPKLLSLYAADCTSTLGFTFQQLSKWDQPLFYGSCYYCTTGPV